MLLWNGEETGFIQSAKETLFNYTVKHLLNANNVQDAIDELSENLEGLKNYSTDERIVGKWIDGRNVYEVSKQFDVKASSIGSNSFNYITPAIASSVDFAISVNGTYSFIDNGVIISNNTLGGANAGTTATITHSSDAYIDTSNNELKAYVHQRNGTEHTTRFRLVARYVKTNI